MNLALAGNVQARGAVTDDGAVSDKRQVHADDGEQRRAQARGLKPTARTVGEAGYHGLPVDSQVQKIARSDNRIPRMELLLEIAPYKGRVHNDAQLLRQRVNKAVVCTARSKSDGKRLAVDEDGVPNTFPGGLVHVWNIIAELRVRKCLARTAMNSAATVGAICII